jgi:hypothetical protein
VSRTVVLAVAVDPPVLQRYRIGIEGRISRLKRGYELRPTRLKGDEGMRTWTGWAILAYNLDTLAIRAR